MKKIIIKSLIFNIIILTFCTFFVPNIEKFFMFISMGIYIMALGFSIIPLCGYPFLCVILFYFSVLHELIIETFSNKRIILRILSFFAFWIVLVTPVFIAYLSVFPDIFEVFLEYFFIISGFIFCTAFLSCFNLGVYLIIIRLKMEIKERKKG